MGHISSIIGFLGLQKRLFTDVNLPELCRSSHVFVSVQAAMSYFQQYFERMSGRIYEKHC